MTKCERCYHNKVCINGANYKNVETCNHFKDKDLIAELPCKVGDVVYTNLSMSGWYMRIADRPYKATIVYIGINGVDNYMNVVLKNDNMLSFKFSDIGKSVFLTREEAEAALEECENNDG